MYSYKTIASGIIRKPDTILVENIENRNRNWWFYKNIQNISEKLGIEP
jgi:hypothetical protein